MCIKAGLSDTDAQSLMNKIGDKAVKDQLKETTQKALDMGVSNIIHIID